MARNRAPDAAALYTLHEQWIRDAVHGGSLISPGSPVWTLEHLDEVERHFVQQPDTAREKTFLEKLRGQMAGASPLAVQLMAEMHVVHLLHIWNGAISAARKRADVEAILSWMPAPPPLPEDVLATFGPGLAHPGQWVLSRRDTQLVWLVRFTTAWLRLDDAAHAGLESDPWAFKQFVWSVDTPSSDGARYAMQHLTFPDVFDPIVSGQHREAIVSRFAGLVPSADEDVDRTLLAVRQVLTPEYGERFDWYDRDLLCRWQKPPKTWRPFLAWVEQFRARPEFDAWERDYKLVCASLLSAARSAVLTGRADWREELRRALTTKSNNITRWTVHDRFLRWVRAQPEQAHAALMALWGDGGEKPWDRLRHFFATVPADVLSNRGERLNLGSYLLMAEDAAHRPPFKISTLRAAFRLLGWPSDSDIADDADVYRRALVFFEEVCHEGRGWPAPLRDPLDAQGAVWAVLTYPEVPDGWSEAMWADLVRYRTSSVDSADLDPGDDDGGLATIAPAEATTASDAAADVDDDLAVDYIAAAAADLCVDRAWLDEIVQLLDDKSQVVLYGPPGTGKTYLALRLARALARGDESRVSIVQFHPATTYEDFIEGLRPRVDAGQIVYDIVHGPLVLIADAARRDEAHRYVLVIDEINRANLPKVFGELLFLLEYRRERIRLIHRPGEPFGLPPNLLVIGTMNTADRSIALIDAAMRRRFHFVPFFPHEGEMRELLRRWLQHHGGRVGVANLLDAVNAELRDAVGEHLLIGPSHFMRTDLSDAALERVWTYNVFPLVEEQFWGDRAAIERWRWRAVRERFAHALESVETAPESDDDEPGAADGDALSPDDADG